MNPLLEDDHEDDRAHPRDREITLGTTMVLGIFFALAVLCAAFFGFGYSLGSKHASGTTIAAGPTSSATFSILKPSPGSPLGTPAKPPAATDTTPVPTAPPAATKTVPINTGAEPSAETADEVPTPKAPAKPPAAPNPAPAGSTVPSANPSGATFFVQVGALSHQEDADSVASALRRKNYAVTIRQEQQDKLFHVQIGPFATHKDADAVRIRVLADGFNAYIK